MATINSMARYERDDNPRLRLNLAAADLARDIFLARARAYGHGGVSWECLSPEVHQQYITRATELLKTLTPRVVVTGLHIGRVIGAIAPEMLDAVAECGHFENLNDPHDADCEIGQ